MREVVPVEWVDRVGSTGRCILMEFGPVRVEIPVPDDLWLCDLCNAEIADLRIIPVIFGRALCRECARRFYGFDPMTEFPAEVSVVEEED
ncbi:MAG: hypothetical protein ACPLRW_05735 [Moorellales bacterium]